MLGHGACKFLEETKHYRLKLEPREGSVVHSGFVVT